MDDDKVKLRMIELRRPIDKAIMMCDINACQCNANSAKRYI